MIEIVKENGIPVEKIVNKREKPINLKAVGDPRGNEKIYMEDYVNTFIRQIADKDDAPKALILYGETRKEEEQTAYFVYGAVLAEEVTANDKTIFGESIWKDVNKKAAHFFPNTQIMGWIYIRYDMADFAQEKILNTHKQFFRPEQKVYIEYSAFEKKECVYLVSKDKLKKQEGYYIYYESNEPMQNYMVTIKQEEPEEVKPEVDRAAKKSRAIVREKKEEIKHRQTMGMLYGSSMAMLLVVTIVGVTLLNNYNKMQSMERVLNNISDQMSDSENDKDALALTGGETLYVSNTNGNEFSGEKETQNGAESELTDETETQDDVIDTEEKTQAETELTEEITEKLTEEATEELTEEITEEITEELTETSEKEDLTGSDIEEENVTIVSEPADNNASTEAAVPSVYTIQKGDTLSQISIRFYGNENKVELICELNNIPDKNSIKYGTNINLP